MAHVQYCGKEKDHLEDLGIDGMILLEVAINVNWIDMDQDRDKWRDLLNTVIKFWVP